MKTKTLVLACFVAACGAAPSAEPSSPTATTTPTKSEAPAPPPPTSSNASPSDAVTQAANRVRAMLDSIDDGAIKDTFSKDFLAAIPPAQITQMFSAAHKSLGQCTSQRPLKVNSATSAVIRIECEKGALDATIEVNANAPHLIETLALRPARS